MADSAKSDRGEKSEVADSAAPVPKNCRLFMILVGFVVEKGRGPSIGEVPGLMTNTKSG